MGVSAGSRDVRILLIHQAFAALGEPGGTRHHEFCRWLTEQGHAVTVVTGRLSYLTGQPVSSQAVPKEETDDAGVRIVRCWSYRSYHRSFVHRVLSFLSFMITSFVVSLRQGRLDIVWGTSPPLMQGGTAWAVARLRRAAFVFEVRDLWPEFAIAVGVLRNRALIRLSLWLEGFLYRKADALVVNSPGFIEHVQRRGASQVQLIPNGVAVEMFRPAEQGRAFRQAHRLAQCFVVLYAGAHGLSNDLGIVLDAAAQLRSHPEIAFVLLGDGKEKPGLMARATAEGLDNVCFVAPLPKREMAEALAAANACLAILKPLPAYRTTYPNKVFDYMAAGRPTLLAIDGVIRQVVEEAGAGVFVPPGDGVALAEAILHLSGDGEACRRMGLAARRAAERSFDRRQLAARLLEVMEAARASHQARKPR
jgi:glycosyltransferase involved in cell wall biosynthesis